MADGDAQKYRRGSQRLSRDGAEKTSLKGAGIGRRGNAVLHQGRPDRPPQRHEAGPAALDTSDRLPRARVPHRFAAQLQAHAQSPRMKAHDSLLRLQASRAAGRPHRQDFGCSWQLMTIRLIL